MHTDTLILRCSWGEIGWMNFSFFVGGEGRDESSGFSFTPIIISKTCLNLL